MSDIITLERHVSVDGIFNLRDLGGYETPDGTIAWRRLFRADGIHRTGEPGLDQMRPLHLRTVIDLRTREELSSHGAFAYERLGARYHHMPIIENVWDAELFDAVTDAATFLTDRYIDMLLQGGISIAQALAVLAHRNAYPVVFHCAAGKDRTGVFAAVVLSLLDVDAETIADDYALSAVAMQRMQDWAAVNRPDVVEAMAAQPRAFLEAPPAAIRGLLDWVTEEYGSMRTYVSYLGVEDSMIAAVRSNLIIR